MSSAKLLFCYLPCLLTRWFNCLLYDDPCRSYLCLFSTSILFYWFFSFVLDHCAKPDLRSGEIQGWRQHLKLLAQAPNVFCKLSGLATEAHWRTWTLDTLRPAVDFVLEQFGEKRVLFGSDWPVCQCATTYARWVESVEALLAGIARPLMAAVFGGNARAAYDRLAPATT